MEFCAKVEQDYDVLNNGMYSICCILLKLTSSLNLDIVQSFLQKTCYNFILNINKRNSFLSLQFTYEKSFLTNRRHQSVQIMVG